MAISYVVGPVYLTALISVTTNLVVPMTGFLPGDLVVVMFASNRTGCALRSGVGWNSMGNYSSFTLSFYKVIGENEPSISFGPSSGSGWGHAVTLAYRGCHYKPQVMSALYSSGTNSWATNNISPLIPSGIMGCMISSVNTPTPVVLVPPSGVTEFLNNTYSNVSHWTGFHKNITDTVAQNFSGTVANTSSKVCFIYCIYEAIPPDSNLSLSGVGR